MNYSSSEIEPVEINAKYIRLKYTASNYSCNSIHKLSTKKKKWFVLHTMKFFNFQGHWNKYSLYNNIKGGNSLKRWKLVKHW